MSEISPEARAALDLACHRLHHLSMRYVGALMEVTSGAPISFVPQGHPGLRECRDFIDLCLFCRAEINALTGLLIEANLLDAEAVTRRMAAEYEFMTQAKAKQLGCEVDDRGLVFKVGQG